MKFWLFRVSDYDSDDWHVLIKDVTPSQFMEDSIDSYVQAVLRKSEREEIHYSTDDMMLHQKPEDTTNMIADQFIDEALIVMKEKGYEEIVFEKEFDLSGMCTLHPKTKSKFWQSDRVSEEWDAIDEIRERLKKYEIKLTPYNY